MDVYFQSLGSYVPGTVTTEWAVRNGLYDEEERAAHQLVSAAVGGDTPAPEMALYAAEDAVKRCGRDGGDLDALFYLATWHQGPEGWLPHAHLQRQLVGGEVPSTEIRQGCNGMFAGLRLATAILRSGRAPGAALLVAADNYGTPLVDRWRMGRGYIAGDAASAVLLGTEPGFARLSSVCSVTVPEAEGAHRGDEPLFPPGITVGEGVDFATRAVAFATAARTRPDTALAQMRVQRQLRRVAEDAVAEAGIGLGEVSRVAFMNYSREIVQQVCMDTLDLPMSRSVWDYGSTIGHCGASDQVLALDHLLRTGALRPGDHVLMLGSGPGVMLAAAVVEILEIPAWATAGERP
ncbi:ketoacyl-ACP synthase III family protein [Saccharomonospora halophila]|uniref:ketoacyl-ACP synthase III family protein n=1 Tax=Saccharomonospora halophila TaxID=129922 RepID=UPI000584EFC5|nr:ketoacyl-ACP synthase III family protein [Saccharomonospora halophila]